MAIEAYHVYTPIFCNLEFCFSCLFYPMAEEDNDEKDENDAGFWHLTCTLVFVGFLGFN